MTANLPAHATIMFSELKRIALFEFIPYEWFTEQAKTLLIKDKYEADFEGNSIIDEIGVMLPIGCALGIVTILTLLLGLVCRKSKQCSGVVK